MDEIRAILADVTTGAPQNVRDALTQLLAEEMMFGSDGSDGGYLRRVADRILALLRPVEDGTPAATCNDLRARLANIAALHQKREGLQWDVCEECTRLASRHAADWTVEIEVQWPCETARILGETQPTPQQTIDRTALLDLFRDDPRIGNPEAMRDRVLALVQPDASCDDLRARLANIAELRDEMRAQPGGSVVWIDDLDEILDGPHPGAALIAEEAELAAEALRYRAMNHPEDASHDWGVSRWALAARLEGQQ